MNSFRDGVIVHGKTRFKIPDICAICHEEMNLNSFTVFGSCGHMLCTSCYVEMAMKTLSENETCPMCRKNILFRMDKCTHQRIGDCEYIKDVHTIYCNLETNILNVISRYEQKWIRNEQFELHNKMSMILIQYIQGDDSIFCLSFSKLFASYVFKQLSYMILEINLKNIRDSPIVVSAVKTSVRWLMSRISCKIKKVYNLIYTIMTYLLPNTSLIHNHWLFNKLLEWSYEQTISADISNCHMSLDSCILECLLPIFRENKNININIYLKYIDLYRSVYTMNSYNTKWIQQEVFEHLSLSNKHELIRVVTHLFSFCDEIHLNVLSENTQALMHIPNIIHNSIETVNTLKLRGSMSIPQYLDFISATTQVGILIGCPNFDLQVAQLLELNVIHQRAQTIHLYNILQKIFRGSLDADTFFCVVKEWEKERLAY